MIAMVRISPPAFRRTILAYYRAHKRNLPWRRTRDPYRILVSEMMLQQTQAPRVIEPYRRFIKRFPTPASLAQAPFKDVYALWSGLGYNRRARYLKDAAKVIMREHNGKVPDTRSGLESLPGVGPYTAGAVLAFAYGQREPLIETNIRTVFIHFFFPGRRGVSDAELLPYIEKTLPKKDFREWFNALMDYGVMLKETKGNAGARSAHYVKQKAFKGSRRELRGKALKMLLKKRRMTRRALMRELSADGTPHDVNSILDDLERDTLIKKRGGTIVLA